MRQYRPGTTHIKLTSQGFGSRIQWRSKRAKTVGDSVVCTSSAPVAQGIEQRFPKPLVACSTHAGGANEIKYLCDVPTSV